MPLGLCSLYLVFIKIKIKTLLDPVESRQNLRFLDDHLLVARSRIILDASTQ